MSLPQALKNGVVSSGACVGNCVYNDLPDDEFYAVVPGDALEKLAAELSTIVERPLRRGAMFLGSFSVAGETQPAALWCTILPADTGEIPG